MLCSFLRSPFSSNIPFSTLVCNTRSLCSSFNARDQVSCPHRITGKIIILCILIFMLFNSRWENTRLWTEWQQALPEFSLLLISSWIRFSLSLSFPNTWTVTHFQMTCFISVCPNSVLYSGNEDTNIYVAISQILSPASSGFTEEHASSSGPQWRAILPAVSRQERNQPTPRALAWPSQLQPISPAASFVLHLKNLPFRA
jgi:hypothetical protein